MGCTIWNGRRSAGHDTVAVEMRYWRRGRRGMVGGRMEGMGLMETKVPAGLTRSVSKGHEGKEKGGEVRHVKGGEEWKRGGRRKDELRRTKGDI
jgi:hypothetical protein